MDQVKLLDNLINDKSKFYKELEKVIIGQKGVIDYIFIAFLCRGHVLLEGVPGLGKTLLIKTISDILELNFSRIQFTPDLMPSDITGTEIISQDLNTGERQFKFIKGPLFANVILADEINRTPPKTQAALLEAMQENRVTIGVNTHQLEEPFFVLATQNPIEQEGTYPLPEAQLDRFMFNILIKYPTFLEENEIVKSNTTISNKEIKNILNKEDLINFQNLVMEIPVSDNLIEYSVKLTHMTRPSDSAPEITKKYIDWGAGPRASSFLVLGAKARAALRGAPTPTIDDVNAIANPVLRHRVIPNFNAEAEGINIDELIGQLIKDINV